MKEALAIEALRGQLVLLVDDAPEILEPLGEVLQIYGAVCVLASNGAEALAKFSLQRKQFTGVIVDMQMPGMDGLELIRRLRGLDVAVPVVLLTGQEPVEGEELSKINLFARLQKPVELATLLEVVSQFPALA